LTRFSYIGPGVRPTTPLESNRRWIHRLLGRRRSRNLAILIGIIVFSLIVVFMRFLTTRAADILAFERSMTLPGGVSTVFPTLFVAVGMMAWIYSQLKRRSLMHWYNLPSGPSNPEPDPSAYELILAEFRVQRAKLEAVIEKPWQIIGDVNPAIA